MAHAHRSWQTACPATHPPHFLRAPGAILAAAWAVGLATSAAAAGAGRPPASAPAHPGRVILETGFEEGEPLPPATQHQLAEGKARGGSRALMGSISRPKEARFLEVPFESPGGRKLHVSFWVCGSNGTGCAVWVRVGKDRRRIGGLPKLSPQWQQVQCSFTIEGPAKGLVEIVTPSSYGAPPGAAWIDDLAVLEMDQPGPAAWPEASEDFPALAADGSGRFWLAWTERSGTGSAVCIAQVAGDGSRRAVRRLAPEGATGIAAPAVAGLADGCIVAWPVEQGGRWRIAVAVVPGEGGGQAPQLMYLDAGGTSNISPAVALTAEGDRACILWESNAGQARGIHAGWVVVTGPGLPHPAAAPPPGPQRLSATAANSYNPAVVALPDGRLFAAWDSLRDGSADIYGAEFRDGCWGDERRLTSAARIERHPALAARGGEVWMAWQAQSYPAMKVNLANEQLIAVARIDANGLSAPRGLFERISRPGLFLLRPRVAFDASGALWLTARQSVGAQAGWLGVAWRYDGGGWSAPVTLAQQQGRWRPVALAFGADEALACLHCDDLPGGWTERGIHPGWHSAARIAPLGDRAARAAGAAAAAPVALQTEPLRMPETDFSVAGKLSLVAADLPRQKLRHGGKELTLFWGDLHDHTDLSVCQRRMNPPGHDLFANLRDIDRLDFCALTDHGYNFDAPQWAFNAEQTRANHDPGRFVTFLGQEWTSSKNPPAGGGKPRPEAPNRYGHHNLIFLDPGHGRFYDSFDGDISPADLWKQLAGVQFVCIPHQLADWKGKGGGNPPKDWRFTDEHLQPVAEIFQARQSYEYLGCPRQAPEGAGFQGFYLQDAWAGGIVIGVIASPDHGGGNGKAGVWAEELTRQAIFEALRARHTFGTSGAKMALSFRAGEALMGDKTARPEGPIGFEVRATALREIRELVIFRNNRAVHRLQPHAKQLQATWTDDGPPDEKLLWYYVRIQASDDELAWSSPIWFTR